MDIKTKKIIATIVADNPPRTHKLKMVRRQKQQPNEGHMTWRSSVLKMFVK